MLRTRSIAAALFIAAARLAAQTSAPPQAVTLFENVRVLDRTGHLTAPTNVLVRGNHIERISSSPIPTDRMATTKIIAGNGRTLMPGLIDAHVHVMMESLPQMVGATADIGYINLLAARSARAMLLRGFTTVRDVGGPSFSIKRAIDEGMIPGPRIYPSGAIISQTGGHGDFRMPYEIPKAIGSAPSHTEQIGMSAIADSPDEVRLRARENLMKGAALLKLTVGGGVASEYDPLDVTQFTEAEIHAAVEATENWGTYVTVHAYTPRAIQTAIAAGVKCIEHGQLADEASAKLMAQKGTWWSLQPFLDDEDAIPYPKGTSNWRKQMDVAEGTDNAYKLAKKYHIKTAWGTDILFDPKQALREGAQIVKLLRWYTAPEVLKMVTADNAELMTLSGPRNPYPGKLGVVEQGAYADLLLVDGDPTANLNLVADPDKNFLVIMKDGTIYKNTLTP